MSWERVEADQIEGVPAPETQHLVGHERAYAGILAALDAGRPPSAIMLHGPRGIGKATFAFTLARELLTRTSDESAERVDAQIASMAHPNLFVLRRARDLSATDKFYTAIRVEDVRTARDALQRTRGRAGYRIAIIDSVDDCNANSANALLKTLEEPPAETLFIVLSHRPGGLLPTIRSRCQSIALRPLPDDEVSAIVSAIKPDTDAETLARAIRFGGRPRRALETRCSRKAMCSTRVTWLDALTSSRSAPSSPSPKACRRQGCRTFLARTSSATGWPRRPKRRAGRGFGAFPPCSANALWDKASARRRRRHLQPRPAADAGFGIRSHPRPRPQICQQPDRPGPL